MFYYGANILLASTWFTIYLAQNMTIEEIDFWGNLLSAVGAQLSTLASLPVNSPGQDTNNQQSSER